MDDCMGSTAWATCSRPGNAMVLPQLGLVACFQFPHSILLPPAAIEDRKARKRTQTVVDPAQRRVPRFSLHAGRSRVSAPVPLRTANSDRPMRENREEQTEAELQLMTTSTTVSKQSCVLMLLPWPPALDLHLHSVRAPWPAGIRCTCTGSQLLRVKRCTVLHSTCFACCQAMFVPKPVDETQIAPWETDHRVWQPWDAWRIFWRPLHI